MALSVKQYLDKESFEDTNVDSQPSLYRFSPQDIASLKYKGEVVAYVLIDGLDSDEQSNMSKFVWQAFLDSYREASGSVIECVESALTSASMQIRKISGNYSNDLSLNIGVVVDLSHTTYFAQLGDMDFFVYRDDEFSNLSKVLNDGDVEVGSFKGKVDDVILLGIDQTWSRLADELVEDSIFQMTKSFVEEIGLHGQVISITFGEDIEEVDSDSPVNEGQLVSEEFSEFKEYAADVTSGDYDDENFAVKAQIASGSLNEKVVNRDSRENVSPSHGDSKNENTFFRSLTLVKGFFEGLGDFVLKIFVPIWNGLITIVGSTITKILGLFSKRYYHKKWYKRLNSKISLVNMDRASRKVSKLKLGDYKLKQQRTRRLALAISAMAVGFVLFMGYRAANNVKLRNDFQDNFQTQVQVIEDKISEVEVPGGESLAILAEVDGLVEGIDEDSKYFTDENATVLGAATSKISDAEDIAYKRTRLSPEATNIDLFYDFVVELGEDSVLTDIEIYTDEDGAQHLLFVDQALAKVYRLSFFDKKLRSLPGDVLKSPTKVSVGVKGVYVYDEEVGMVRYADDGSWYKSPEVLEGLLPKEFGAGVDEFTVLTANDFIYTLSSAEGRIYKSTNAGANYFDPYIYYESDDVVGSTDLFGELYIYTVGANQNVGRYISSDGGQTLGEDVLDIGGISGSLDTIIAGYTGEDLNKGFYVLGNVTDELGASVNSIVKFEKPIESGTSLKHPGELQFKHQYIYAGQMGDIFGVAQDIVVNDIESKAYVLSEGRVWVLDL